MMMLFANIMEQLEKLNPEDIKFIIQKKTCQKAEFFDQQVQVNVVEGIKDMIEDYEIEEDK